MKPIAFVALAFGSIGCSPELPPGSGAGGGPVGAPTISLEPPVGEAGAARVVRAHVDGGVDPIDPASCAVIAGSVGKAHLKQLADGDISSALEARLVPSVAWNPDGDARRAVVAPTALLQVGTIVSFACGSPPVSVEVSVATTDAITVLDRVWPPVDGGGALAGAVWCGASALPVGTATGVVEPAQGNATFATGATPAGIGGACVRAVQADAASPDDAAVPPLSIDLGGATFLLSPESFFTAPGEPFAPAVCEPDEIAFGAGCARVLDDRALVRSPPRPQLWGIAWADQARVIITAPDEPFVLRPLPPASAVAVLVESVDAAGASTSQTVDLVTLPPLPHVVLNEVLANAKGPEPDQEWIELYNDGVQAVDLEGFVLGDVGGETVLPAGVLGPGQYAVLVNETYVPDGEYDPAPAPGTLLLSVPHLGKNGLSNEGEMIKLSSPDGTVVSRFADQPKPKAGISVVRISPEAPDGWAGSFALSSGTSSPGAPNLPAPAVE